MEYAISNPGRPSKCVTIMRSLDGRLQVSHRKGLPHVIYCRIFRWPDLQTHHELRPIETCEFSFNSKQTEVCINPYHYERVDIPILPAVLVPKHAEFSTGHSVIHQQQSSQQNNFNYPTNQNNSFLKINPNQNYENYYSTSACNTPDIPKENYQTYSNQQQLHQQQWSTPYNQAYATNLYSNSSSSNGNYYSSSYGSPQTLSDESVDMSPSNNQSYNNTTDIEHYQNQNYQEKPCSWCSLVYYELNSRIGEIFHSFGNEIFVDGYTSPCSDRTRRFSLGAFSNVNRSSTIENCRRHIGKGIHLYNDNGDVYVECLSESPIFIQSRNCNYDRGFHPNTVCKLLSGYSLRIFRSKIFVDILKEATNGGYDTVYDLSHMCVIKLSFVKGWGAEYYRQDVSSCPCWIEIRLNEPFQMLDRVLKEMGSSKNPASSIS